MRVVFLVSIFVFISTYHSVLAEDATNLTSEEEGWFVKLDGYEKCECIKGDMESCDLRQEIQADRYFFGKSKINCFGIGNGFIGRDDFYNNDLENSKFKNFEGKRSCTVYKFLYDQYRNSVINLFINPGECTPKTLDEPADLNGLLVPRVRK